jgi:outer membrane protein assembly factor BamB
MILSDNERRSTTSWIQMCVPLSVMFALVLDIASAQDATTPASDARKAPAEDKDYWNQFRGPRGDGTSDAKSLPVEFGETKNVRWNAPIHDEGWSSPVVWGNQIWLTTARRSGQQLYAICVDLESGAIVHDIKVFDVADPQKAYEGYNTHATPTPIVEEGHVYVHYGAYGTACLDTRSGERVWERRDLKCDHRVRPASSPIIDGDSLFLVYDGVDAQFIVALDKNTGKTRWRQERKSGVDFDSVLKANGVTDIEKVKEAKPNDNRKAYATPTIIEYQGKRQLISPAAEVTFSYDPETGAELWRVRHPGMGWNAACRPVFAHGLVYFTTGFSRRLLAVRPSGTGDVTETHVAWSTNRSVPAVPSPLIIDDLLFMVSDEGSVSCLQATTGRELWRQRLPAGGSYWASPVCADSKIYFSGKNGIVSVIAATRDFQLLADNRFEAGFIASPAIAGAAIVLRSLTHLYCVAQGGEMAAQPGVATHVAEDANPRYPHLAGSLPPDTEIN